MWWKKAWCCWHLCWDLFNKRRGHFLVDCKMKTPMPGEGRHVGDHRWQSMFHIPALSRSATKEHRLAGKIRYIIGICAQKNDGWTHGTTAHVNQGSKWEIQTQKKHVAIVLKNGLEHWSTLTAKKTIAKNTESEEKGEIKTAQTPKSWKH